MILFGYRIPMMASLIVWGVLWEIVGQLELVTLFPPLSGIFAAMAEVVSSGKFADATMTTLESFFIGMALAITFGIVLGILMGRFTVCDRLFGMWVNIFVSAPLSALVPVIMILFGMGQTTIIVSVFLFAVWIITLDTRAGVRHISPSLKDMCRSFGASRSQMLRHLILPASLPEILAGIRVGLIRGVKGVVIGQLLVSIIGYGELFELYSRYLLMEEFWALTLILFAFALLVGEGVSRIEKSIEYYAGERST